MALNEVEMAPKWRLHDDSTRNQFPIAVGLFCRWGFSHAARFKVELRARGLFLGVRRKIEEIDGGGGLFVCPIHGGGRGGKKHWNINFLFAVFIIGRRRRRRSEMTNGAREEMNSVFPPAGGTDAKFQPRRGAFFGTVWASCKWHRKVTPTQQHPSHPRWKVLSFRIPDSLHSASGGRRKGGGPGAKS